MNFAKIGIAADHSGKKLKSILLDYGKLLEVEMTDYGVSTTGAKAVDYPDYVALLARDIKSGKLDGAVAICGTGLGMSMAANKYSGIRAVCVWDEYSCLMGREHNNANVLCLGARTLNYHRATDLLKIWLSTEFQGGRHTTRMEKLSAIEQSQFK